jgi:diguanylate cyclase (GGDEF)-like protein/PAS domain S-box-containing protein
MNLDLMTISLVLGLTHFVLASILWVHFQKDEIFRGRGWWITGIALFGGFSLFLYLENITSFGLFPKIVRNILLVSGSLAIYRGSVKFFNLRDRTRNLIFFIAGYLFITTIFYILGYPRISHALSYLSVGVLSSLNARIVNKQETIGLERMSIFLPVTFSIHASIFFLQGILVFLSPEFLPAQTPIVIDQIIYFVVFIHSTLWTFGFVALLNQRLLKNSGEARHIYNLTINTIPDAVLITRLQDGKLLKINQGFTKLSGFTPEDIVGKSTLDIDLWADPSERSKFVILLTQTGSVENMEFKFQRKNGRPLMGLVSARTLKLDGESCVITVARDITSRKKMEEKLRENEEKYRFLTENSGEVIWHINRSFRVDYISTADETIRGFKREEVVGQPIWSIFKPEGVQLIRQKVEYLRQSEEVGNNKNVTRFEIEQRCKDGSWIWTEITAAPHYDKHGSLIGYHGISRDISEKKRMLEKLHQQATMDDLCQIPNRRHFMHLAEKELQRAKRYHHPLSIVAIDFDNLKKINDTYGHLAGDRALCVFSKIVQTLIRDIDFVGRLGGDEYLIMLPETESHHAYHVVERIYHVLDASPIFFKGEHFKIAISSGIASLEDWTDSLENLLSRADAALYKAKQNGGLKIVISQEVTE